MYLRSINDIKKIQMVKFDSAVRYVRRNNSLRYFATKLSQNAENSSPCLENKFLEQLERLSLVNFGSEKSLARLGAAINFAKQLQAIKLDDDIKPMYTVLENERLYLREDKVTDGGYPKEILKNAVLKEEGYFVAPPGNVPVNLTDKKY